MQVSNLPARIANSEPQDLSTALVAEIFENDALCEHLTDVSSVHKTRLILRSWFLAEVLQSDSTTPTVNPATLEDNVYAYELIDGFLSSLLQKGGSQL